MHIKLTPETENPRWTICRAALGREPAGWEFSLWIDQRWRDFREARGVPRIPGESAMISILLGPERMSLEDLQASFDYWLKGEVEAGKYQEV